ncbi:methyl-accepting chemotaxis protein [Clostridiaceae bacterium UIB06]|uniref:Methyl-accepting chemotaxis protein n=1 Tax=Clostridium thailandense TaxID=2794346 RepID=A0A949WSK9_9CLOT|nr:methyl-accepting chemotaxis protein [Clostridium thailandense]MBV7275196.1 methyl-accepting chemotaxis protein [Clostridium thailandense]MCH5136832.1 methyl-accepting chemotaxis protein [Clostridiaceae bacterium UIB06]
MKLLINMKVKTKLTSAFLCIILLIGIIAVKGLLELYSRTLNKLCLVFLSLDKIIQLNSNDAKNDNLKNQEIFKEHFMFTMCLSIISFILAALLSTILTKQINSSLSKVKRFADRLANGTEDVSKLSEQIYSSKDEINKSIKELTDKSNEIQSSIHDSTKAIEEISKATENQTKLASKLNEMVQKFKV